MKTKEQSLINKIENYCISVLAEKGHSIYDSESVGRKTSCTTILNKIQEFKKLSIKTRQPQ